MDFISPSNSNNFDDSPTHNKFRSMHVILLQFSTPPSPTIPISSSKAFSALLLYKTQPTDTANQYPRPVHLTAQDYELRRKYLTALNKIKATCI